MLLMGLCRGVRSSVFYRAPLNCTTTGQGGFVGQFDTAGGKTCPVTSPDTWNDVLSATKIGIFGAGKRAFSNI